ncbi:MAG: hypothetical protein ACN4GK_11745, partial [Acidimicrobiia bacterium]
MRRLIVLSLLLASCSGAGQEAITVPSTPPAPTSTVQDPVPTTTASAISPSTTLASSTSTTATTIPLEPLQSLAYEEVVSGLAFPIFVDAPPDDSRLFIVTKDGRIWLWKDGSLLQEPFLDIADEVRNEGEQGLLGLAFDPAF